MMELTITGKTIKISKDCQVCTHRVVCRFREASRAFGEKGSTYEMNAFPEWNNVHRVFELHSKCQYYTLMIPAGPVTSKSYRPLIEKVVYNEIADRKIKWGRIGIKEKESILSIDDVDRNLDEFIDGYTVI
jgi:hypothetical protein